MAVGQLPYEVYLIHKRDGKIVKKYPSMSFAAKDLGFAAVDTVSRAVRNHRLSYGTAFLRLASQWKGYEVFDKRSRGLPVISCCNGVWRWHYSVSDCADYYKISAPLVSGHCKRRTPITALDGTKLTVKYAESTFEFPMVKTMLQIEDPEHWKERYDPAPYMGRKQGQGARGSQTIG